MANKATNMRISTSKKNTVVPTTASESFPSNSSDPARKFAVIYDWAPTENRDIDAKLKAIEAEKYILVYQNIDPNAAITGTIDPEKIVEEVRRKHGDNPTGWGMLDYENPFDHVLHSGPDHPMYGQCIKTMLQALQHVKEKFPRVKWTYYGIPGLSYWLDGKLWAFAGEKAQRAEIEKQMLYYGPLLEAVDWYTPCVYDVYDLSTMDETSKAAHVVNEKAYRIARVNVIREFLKDRNLPSRPILPAVCPFFVGGGNTIDNKLIPKEELVRDQLDPIVSAGCDGMAIWSASDWYILHATLPTNPANGVQARVRKMYTKDFFGGNEPADWTDPTIKQTLVSGVGNAIADMGTLAVQIFRKVTG